MEPEIGIVPLVTAGIRQRSV